MQGSGGEVKRAGQMQANADASASASRCKREYVLQRKDQDQDQDQDWAAAEKVKCGGHTDTLRHRDG